MSWREITTSEQLSRDSLNHRRGLREFRVWNYSRAQILSDPTAIIDENGIPLPGYGSVWNGMRLDRYDVTPIGTFFDATALYSNDQRFTLPTNPPALRGSWTGSFQTEQIPIPYAVKEVTTVVTLVQGGPPISQSVEGWKFYSEPTDHKFERIGQQVYMDAATIANARSAIRAQANKIHKIFGTYYLFEPGDYAEQDDGRWRMQYQWTRDPGTNVVGIHYVDDFLWVPDFTTCNFEFPAGSGEFYTRPPWQKLVITNPSSVPSADPVFKVIPQKDFSDLTGWQTLPGFTP